MRSGKIPLIAPFDFMDFTVSENVYAGNAMNRRLFLPIRPAAARRSARLCRTGTRPGCLGGRLGAYRAEPPSEPADRGVRVV